MTSRTVISHNPTTNTYHIDASVGPVEVRLLASIHVGTRDITKELFETVPELLGNIGEGIAEGLLAVLTELVERTLGKSIPNQPTDTGRGATGFVPPTGEVL